MWNDEQIMAYWFCGLCKSWYQWAFKMEICDDCWIVVNIAEDNLLEFNRLNCIHIYKLIKDDQVVWRLECKECRHRIEIYKHSFQEEYDLIYAN